MRLCDRKRVLGAIFCGLAICANAASHAATSGSGDGSPSIDASGETNLPGAPTGAEYHSADDPTERSFGSVALALTAAQASPEAVYLGQWIAQRNDSIGMPFAIVDKKQARLHVFDDRQMLVGSSVVLTGAMPGDASAAGVGQRAQSSRLTPHDRTTPAGRFASRPGHNLQGEDIVWFDYGAALAIHRLRPDRSHAWRSARLASATPDDNRASAGCVVVPVAFYEGVVRPWLGTRRGVVYVLPDERPVQAWWPADAPAVARLADGS